MLKMAPKSTFAMEIDWEHYFMLKSIKHYFFKSRFWRIMRGGGVRTPIIHVQLLHRSLWTSEQLLPLAQLKTDLWCFFPHWILRIAFPS